MKKIVYSIVAFLGLSSSTPKVKKDTLQRVKAVHTNLFEMRVAAFHCWQFDSTKEWTRTNIVDKGILRRLEAYKNSATRSQSDIIEDFFKSDYADGKLYFFYKSGKVDSVCFVREYLRINDVPMSVPTHKSSELYNLLDGLANASEKRLGWVITGKKK